MHRWCFCQRLSIAAALSVGADAGHADPAGWNKLRATLPEMAKFQRMVGVKRGYGQAPHNRGILHYREGMEMAEPWKAFIAELHGRGI